MPGVEPVPWASDESATATINYTSGTTARPKGVQLTHRNCWVNSAVFGWHVGVSDRDVYLHTLPMFHANGWGMPWTTAAMGVTQVALRKVDGTRDPPPGRPSRGDPAVRRPRRGQRRARRRTRTGTARCRGRGTTRIVVAGAPPPSRTIERIESELGWEFIQIYGLTETSPVLTVNRCPGRVGRPPLRPAGPQADAGRRAGRGDRAHRRRARRGAGPLQHRHGRLLAPARGDGGRAGRRLVPHRRRRPARRGGPPEHPRPQEGRHHHRRRERLVDRGGGRHLLAGGRPRGGRHRRARTTSGARWCWRSW